jgi:hypothetical protein
VQHVSVNEGGRAIVGSVAQDVPGTSQKTPACPSVLTDSRHQPMPIIVERREGELVPGCRRQRGQARCEEQKARTVTCDEYVLKPTVHAG